MYDPVATAPGSDTKRNPTVELTRRRESKHLSPHELVEKHAPAARVQRFVRRHVGYTLVRFLSPRFILEFREHGANVSIHGFEWKTGFFYGTRDFRAHQKSEHRFDLV